MIFFSRSQQGNFGEVYDSQSMEASGFEDQKFHQLLPGVFKTQRSGYLLGISPFKGAGVPSQAYHHFPYDRWKDTQVRKDMKGQTR